MLTPEHIITFDIMGKHHKININPIPARNVFSLNTYRAYRIDKWHASCKTKTLKRRNFEAILLSVLKESN